MFNRFRKGFILLTAAALISTSVYPASAMAGEVAVQTESETQQTETEAETENLQTEAEETEVVQTETETEQAGTETETEITETEAAETETGTQSETQQANDDPEADRNYRDAAREGFDIQTFSEQEQKEIKAYGIDVSEFNGTIDWNKVKNAGVDFAIIRIGYRGYGTGRIVIDSQALNNLAGAQKAGVKIGAYFFSTAINEEEAVEEAEYVMDILDDYNVTYPIVYDCEGFDNPDYRTYGLSKTARTDNAIAFLNRVEQGGYDAMMYASKSGYENENNWETSRLESLFDMWVAHYPYYTDWGVEYPSYDAVKGTITSYAGEFRMWQFTSQGKIDGISTNVDLDLEYYSEEETEEEPSEKLTVTEESNGTFKITISDVSLPAGATALSVPVWSEDSDQDDIKWYSAQKSGDDWEVTVDPKNHNNSEGKYEIHLYYADKDGQWQFITSTTHTVEIDSTHVSVTNVDTNMGSFTVELKNFSLPSGATTVAFPIWSEKNGQDDIIWYEATKQGDIWYADIKAGNHMYDEGVYAIHAYYADKNGQWQFVTSISTNVVLNEDITQILTENNNDGTVSVCVKNLNLPKNTTVALPVWSVINGQDDLKWYMLEYDDGMWTTTINLKNHKNNVGAYQVQLYFADKNGSWEYIDSIILDI